MPGGRIGSAPKLKGPQPLLWLAWLCAAATVVYVVGAPLWSSDYPMMTDFPFQTAASSVFRHYTDPSWHFHEQFVFQPFSVPYLTPFALSAIFMWVLPPVAATKLATGLLLGLLPVGLMVLSWGLRKSPLLGLWGLLPVWGVLTHWGFVGFVAALGLFAAALGLTLRVIDRPDPKPQIALLAVLVLLFFTHVFRFPFTLAIMVVAGLALWRTADTLRGLIIPVAFGIALFAAWWLSQPPLLSSGASIAWPPRWDRLAEAPSYLSDIFVDDQDTVMFRRTGLLFVLTAAVLAGAALARLRSWPRGRWVVPAHAVVGLAIAVFLCMYLMLPMEMGIWWYVFPREITAAVYLVPALLPNLPRRTWAHLGFAVWSAIGIAPLGELVADAHRDFSATTVHFREIVRELPMAPKLLYLVYDHHGSRARMSPYVHLPAYVQAERGGWLSFHIAQMDTYPIRYRDRSDPDAVVPPPTPLRWEWTPRRFQLEEHGEFFDWFLVRRVAPPDELFAADPTIHRVAHFDDWWLYHREGSTGPPGQSP